MDHRPGTPRRPLIKPANFSWRNGQPFAEDFGDIYHAPDQDQEVQRVFLQPAGAGDKARTAAARNWTLRIGELGFGTGLNFAVTAGLALKAGCRLHFISFEARPIHPDIFTTIASGRMAQMPVYADLRRCYPPLLAGWHRRTLAEGRITLSVYWGDASAGLAAMALRQRQPIDAWFLDGFAPDRNPDIWHRNLLRMLPHFSIEGTTVTTFTAAGRVRRCLQDCGFEMRRIDQRPHKRESLAGVYRPQGIPRQLPPDHAFVAGAGVAGASVARHLAEQGVAVSLFEPSTAAAAGASGIPAALLHPRLLSQNNPDAAWRIHAYAYALAFVQRFPGFVETAILQTQGPNLGFAKIEQIASAYAASGLVQPLAAVQAVRLSGWQVYGDGLWFPHGGVIEPPVLVRALLHHPRISVHFGQLAPQSARPLVLACAGAVKAYRQASILEIAEVHGQVDLVAMDSLPRLPIVGAGHLAPTGAGVVVGATYERRPWSPERATAHNLRSLAGRHYCWLGRTRAARAVASDRTSIVGELGAGVYASVGHGSMGMATAPFAGTLIASSLVGDFAPMTAPMEAGVNPARFLQRQARRGYRLGAEPSH